MILEKMPFLVLTVAVSVVAFYAQGDAVQDAERLPRDMRLRNATVSYVAYLGKTVWPSKLAVFYPYIPATTAETIAATTVLVVISYVFIRRSGSHPHLLVGWLWFLGTLVPVIGLVQIGFQSRADRYSYLPSIGLSLLLAWQLRMPKSRPVQRYFVTAVWLLVVAGLSLVTHRQVRHWRDNTSLFSQALAVTRWNYLACFCVGVDFANQGDDQTAIKYYRQALAWMPKHYQARNNLGSGLARQGKMEEAIAEYQAGLTVAPRYVLLYENLAKAFLQLGRVREAADICRKGLEVDAARANLHLYLGMAHEWSGELEPAIQQYRAAVAADRDCWRGAKRLGLLLAVHPEPSARRPREAVRFAKLACHLTRETEADSLRTLAISYAANGQHTLALEAARQAVDVAKRNGQTALASAVEQLIEELRESPLSM